MKDVFQAIENRFKADRGLRRTARKLYHGPEGPETKPAPHVRVEVLDETQDMDTFDADVSSYVLRFSIAAREGSPENANEIIDHLRRVFDDADLPSPAFATVEMRWNGRIGPLLTDGSFDSEVRFRLSVQRNTMQPLVRHS